MSAVIAKRLRDVGDSPIPGPRRTRESEPTPTPRPYAEGVDPVVRRKYECDRRDGMCGRPVDVRGDRCPACARIREPSW
ncbi:hypothetical protein [Streptomyces sp. NPDC059781]|uniref:hypothetical protein n=1 Tax=Streptomyces sp. NPDC059781 TaxID=3346943 RepID=UPI00364610B1